MTIRKTFRLMAAAVCVCTVLPGCNNEEPNESQPVTNYGGYADPKGVMILNQGPITENSSITYITPEGEVEENVYQKVNGTAFGHNAQDLYMYHGKLYILSDNNDSYDDIVGDGTLVIADAATLQREKVFKLDDLVYKRPEGSLDENEYLPLNLPVSNIVVVDEQNIFFSDQNALYRFNSLDGTLTILEGGYHFGNQGNTIESVASTRGMTVIGDRIYTGGGGFWETTRLLEFQKDKNESTRVIEDLNGDFISGICRTGDREILLATCGRQGNNNSYFYFIDIDSWSIVKEKQVAVDITANFCNNSGITLAGDYVYFAAGTTKISRMSIKTWQVEKNYIDVTNDVPNAKYLTCNVVADPTTQYLYVAASDDYGESVKANNNLLIYDCSGETPKLVNNIANKTNYPVGIYPMSKFY